MSRQGFTLIEVMVSLGVMTVSAMALFGMQAQATRANVRARDVTTASQIAQNLIERLKLDGSSWLTITPGVKDDLDNTTWLKALNPVPTPSIFVTMSERLETRVGNAKTVPLSSAFDATGEDLLIAGAAAEVLAKVRFCGSMRLAWVYDAHRMLRADVRVWWTKEAPSRVITSDFPGCADDNAKLSPGGSLYDNYHVVYLSTVIRPTPL
jgi:prepilin-type N-terminal cleavage/methylation domain-containing protein